METPEATTICKKCGQVLESGESHCVFCDKPPHSLPSAYFSDEEERALSPGAEIDWDTLIKAGDVLDGRFKVIKLLGRGGISRVYLVEDSGLKGKYRALKVVLAEKDDSDWLAEHFIREFEHREKIKNTQFILSVQDPRSARHNEHSLLLLPMEVAEQGSFRRWLKDCPDEERRTKEGLVFFHQACQGVQAAHQAGMIHLDLKPENILLSNGQAKVADFEFSRLIGERFIDAKTDKFQPLKAGTPHYMSPEQFLTDSGKPLGRSSDIYALGVILYELITGSTPFKGSHEELKEQHLRASPPPIHGRGEQWWSLIKRCLKKESQDRYQSVSDLLNDFEKILKGVPASVDVACPKCGHINSDVWMKLCVKCQASLDDRFHSCFRCGRSVRYDQEICKCGFNVGNFYRMQGRMEAAERLKDEDPPKAIDLLDLVLQDGASKFEKHALELINELHKMQTQISIPMKNATEALAASQPEASLKEWRAILALAVRHTVAMERVSAIERMIKDESGKKEKAVQARDHAQFAEAEKLLAECTLIFPNRQETRDLLVDCRKKAEEYRNCFSNSCKANQQKKLNEAKKLLERALSCASESAEAKSLYNHVISSLKQSQEFIEKARSALTHGRFDEAATNLRNAADLQSDHPESEPLSSNLAKSKVDFDRSMREAEIAYKSHDLAEALAIVTTGLNLCPDSHTVRDLLAQIQKDQKETLDLIVSSAGDVRAARFDPAELKLKKARLLWHDAPGLVAAEQYVGKTRSAFEKYMATGRQRRAAGDLDAALIAVRSAKNECPQSGDAEQLEGSIVKEQAKARYHLGMANEAMERADFTASHDELNKAFALWSVNNEILQAMARLKMTEEGYPILLARTKELLERGLSFSADEPCSQALLLCPHSAEALSFMQQIHTAAYLRHAEYLHNKSIEEERREHTVIILKISGIIAISLLLMYFIYNLAIILWFWIPQVAWPWCVTNKPIFGIFIVVLSFVTLAIHRARETKYGRYKMWEIWILVFCCPWVFVMSYGPMAIVLMKCTEDSAFTQALIMGLCISIGFMIHGLKTD